MSTLNPKQGRGNPYNYVSKCGLGLTLTNALCLKRLLLPTYLEALLRPQDEQFKPPDSV
ncbi:MULTISPECIES: hypothetical protein [Calothrix]|uniref:Transposase n=1 Tax=Calothrix parietina FACHB-288 TaxID=2692896 RepID=A0ABR8AKK7_9CYAN|nr:hypothetical protein [Calothrix parietina FACHB-288]